MRLDVGPKRDLFHGSKSKMVFTRTKNDNLANKSVDRQIYRIEMRIVSER